MLQCADFWHKWHPIEKYPQTCHRSSLVPHVDVPVRYILQARKLYTCIAMVQFIESQSLKYQSQGSYKQETPLTAYKVTYM